MRTALPCLWVLVAGTAPDTIAASVESPSRAHDSRAGAALTIEASASPLLIERGAAGRRQMTLPDIEIQATLHVRCSPGSSPTTVSLMSADTRVTANELADREVQDIALILAVPAAQIPPVYTKDFCIENEPGPTTLVKPALVSLQGSLRCSARPAPGTENPNAEDSATLAPDDAFAQASASVDVELRCKPEPEPGEAGSNDTRAGTVSFRPDQRRRAVR